MGDLITDSQSRQTVVLTWYERVFWGMGYRILKEGVLFLDLKKSYIKGSEYIVHTMIQLFMYTFKHRLIYVAQLCL